MDSASDTTRDGLERVLEDLLERGVLTESGEDTITFTPAFREAREERRRRLEDRGDVTDELAGRFPETPPVDVPTAATALAIRDRLPTLDDGRALAVARALSRVDNPLRTAGAPEGFEPILGAELPAFADRHRAAVAFFWRDECEPCEEVRRDLERLRAADEMPDAMGLAAVYGPECAEFARERYDVAVAPTLLFFVEGAVDSRLLGAHPRSTVASELDIVSESIDAET